MEQTNPVPESDESKNYNLKSKAVEDLVDDTAPEYSEEELNRYRKKGFRFPEALKIILLKAWFAGAVCYFILWGLGMYITNTLDQVFVLAMVMGMTVDLLLNSIIRFIEKIPGQNDKWMMVSRKGMVGFGLNLLYGCVIVFCVYQVFVGINVTYVAITGKEDAVILGIEPILFGLLCMAFDMLFIGIKRLFLRILEDAKAAARSR